jgi:hypothetical protein
MFESNVFGFTFILQKSNIRPMLKDCLAHYDITEAALNKSSLLLKINFKTHKHYIYLQTIFKQKLFTKDIKNANQGLGLAD